MQTIGLEEHFWKSISGRAFLEEALLPLEVKHKIAYGSAEKLLKMS